MNHDAYLHWLENSIHWPAGTYRGYVTSDGVLKDRVIKHDVMHLLIAGDLRPIPLRLKFEDEYANAIIQAVLEGAVNLSKVNLSSACNRETPKNEIITNDVVRDLTIHQAVKFMQTELEKEGRKLPGTFRENVSDAFISHYLEVGKNLKALFAERYKTEYVSMNIQDFMTIPQADLHSLYKQAEAGKTLLAHIPALRDSTIFLN